MASPLLTKRYYTFPMDDCQDRPVTLRIRCGAAIKIPGGFASHTFQLLPSPKTWPKSRNENESRLLTNASLCVTHIYVVWRFG